jgi:arylformamidase
MAESAPIWAQLSDEEHELQYNPQRACPDFARFRAARDPENTAALATLEREADVAYGDHPRRRLDIYPAPAHGGRSPVHIYFHGGYWRTQDKENFAFIAGALVPLGVTTVIANYELCPGSTLDGVIASALSAVRWTAREIAGYGGDPAALTLSGHSAGAHIGASVIAHDWAAEGLDGDILKGATLVSGMFDPRPAMRTTVNAQIGLTEELAARHNLEAKTPMVRCPVTLVAGGDEPWHWVDQTFRYYHHLRRHGLSPACHVPAGVNHFNIIDGYMDAKSDVARAVRSHLGPFLSERAGA